MIRHENEADRIDCHFESTHLIALVVGEIAEGDEFISRAIEDIFARIHPPIGDIEAVGENHLVDGDTVGEAGVGDVVKCSLGGAVDGRYADVYRVLTRGRAGWEVPLGCAIGWTGARLDVAH